MPLSWNVPTLEKTIACERVYAHARVCVYLCVRVYVSVCVRESLYMYIRFLNVLGWAVL